MATNNFREMDFARYVTDTFVQFVFMSLKIQVEKIIFHEILLIREKVNGNNATGKK